MSNYTKTVDFAAKDGLSSGASGKLIKGTEFETEFDNIVTAIATKADIAGPTFTGTLTYATLNDGTTALTSTVAELNILDGVTSTAAELNILDGVTSTAAELNILDGVTSTTAELNILDGVTSTTAELNILDGVTASAAELNLIDGVTATTAELNILDGVTSTAAELNILDGVTSTFTELNLLDGVTSTTAELNILDGVTSTAAELNILDGVTSTAAELNILDGVTSTAAELNILDGVTATTAELNYLDIATLGLTAASKAVTADADGVVTHDAGTSGEYTAVTSSSNAVSLNLQLGDSFSHDLTENTTISFANPAASGKVSTATLRIIQGSTARTITWHSSIKWAGDEAPTLSTGDDDVDVFVFYTVDAGTTYYGFTAGQDMS